MKSIAPILFAIISIGLFSCQQAPKADKAVVGDAKEVAVKKEGVAFKSYTIDEGKSRVTFTGTKPVGQHKGYFNVRGGSVSTFGDEIKGGSFSIDINTMTITDAMPVEMANNLKGHLLSEDFFKAETYPVATFNITGVQPLGAGVKVDLAGATHTVSGNLRLLDKTKGISFPAIIKTDGSALKASANFNIDRTDFGMVYGNDKSLGDKFINPIVNIGLNLAARSE